MKKALLLAAAATAAAIAAPASAQNYDFVISGGYNGTFTLPAAPTPSTFNQNDNFTLSNVAGSFQNNTSSVANLQFYSAANNGGIQINDPAQQNPIFLSDGPQLYTGPESAPVFSLGTYTLDATRYGFGISTLAITAAPEPAGWALMILGFGLVGAAMRRAGYRRSSTSVSYANA